MEPLRLENKHLKTKTTIKELYSILDFIISYNEQNVLEMI
ncbi:hypothetical protein BCE_4571 [Bacillus cereus ATCC 10987]|uniref:Uncharacterized protein n=1 Tax=Bacillus cereus (strain ATCC 10987 / NRS 248) TaxID=222523 RepID=Q72ZU6_BACC1|nr:hypothetical protein BCE_4571 [Bacillus cereus ATCC 10987]